MMGFRFGTAINCIDGRTPEVVIDYMKQKYNIEEVDMVTFPCADGLFSNEQNRDRSYPKSSFYIYKKAGSQIIALLGQYDCPGNPCDTKHHNKHIRRAKQ